MKSHYTYKLIAVNPIDERVEYIGVRSCSGLPADDAAYMSSSREIRALIKSGVQFVKEIIAVHENRKKAVAHEVELHDHHDVARSSRFFNKAKQTAVGFDVAGSALSDETKKLMSASHKARLSTKEARAEQSARAKAVSSRPGKRQKMSDVMKVVWENSEYRSKRSSSLSQVFSDESRKRKWLGVRSTSEYQEANAVRNAEKARRPESRRKNSEKAKARMADPLNRENLSKKAKAQMSSVEMRRRLSEATKAQMSNPLARKLLSDAAKRQMSSVDAVNYLKETQKAAQALKRKYFELSGFTGNKRKVTLAQAEAWLATNKKEAA